MTQQPVKSRSRKRLPSLAASSVARLFFMLLIFFVPLAHAAKKTTYCPQDRIDSLIDRAYYTLSSVDDPASGIRRCEAIAVAKRIATQLRSLAANDANRNYILGKVSELEGQIYLEEKGLLLEKEQWQQKNINDLVRMFNKELGKKKPSFKLLWNYHAQMAAIDQRQGGEVKRSIKKRAAALAREIPEVMEASLEKGDLEAARSDLVYCEVSREYLGMSAVRYAALEGKVAARLGAEDEQALVVKSMAGLRVALIKNDLATARKENAFIGRRIRSLRNRIVPHEWNRLSAEYSLLSRRVVHKEDSLVGVGLSLLRKSGPQAASQFIDTMKARGASLERIGQVDHAILQVVISQKRLEPSRDTLFASLESDSTAGGFALSAMLSAAKKRAAEKKDSIHALQAEKVKATQVEEVRTNRLRTAYALRQLREHEKKKTEKQQALQELVAIYTFLELQKTMDAYQKLLYVKALLKNNIPLEDYEKVTAAVERELEKNKSK
ncbi:MAG: hypothetical protein JW768_01025 [Chitinispirillaceae bacterium]|nr:hypothetical protein [Chitinispirillaceae bacterium]